MTWNGRECSYAGSATTFPSGTVVGFTFVNSSSAYRGFSVYHSERDLELATLARPNASTAGYVTLHRGSAEVNCLPESRTSAAEVASKPTAATLTINDPRP